MSRVDHIRGHTFHGRRGAVDNAFRYAVDYVIFDPETPPEGLRLFRRNRRGLMAVQDRDHGGPVGQGRGAAFVREALAAESIAIPGLRLELLTQPRIFGHAFNPVSFWFARDAAGDLRAALAEVNNTFGDRHYYLCTLPDLAPITRSDTISARKVFHVSPFQGVEGGYTFRFDITEEKFGVWIDYRAGENGLYATLTGHRAPLTDRALLGAVARGWRVLALIHWQAFKLFLKGAPYKARVAPPSQEVTR